MPFKVKHAKWLETEVARVGGLLLIHKFWHRAWTKSSLKQSLADLGLSYSMPEIKELNDALHAAGIVEDT